MNTKVRTCYWVALVSWFLLFALLCARIIVTHAPSEPPRSLQLLFLAGPLLLVLMGLLRGSPKAHLFAAVLALLYFCLGIMNAFEPGNNELDTRVYGALQIALSSLLFGAGVLYARWASQALKLNQTATAK